MLLLFLCFVFKRLLGLLWTRISVFSDKTQSAILFNLKNPENKVWKLQWYFLIMSIHCRCSVYCENFAVFCSLVAPKESLRTHSDWRAPQGRHFPVPSWPCHPLHHGGTRHRPRTLQVPGIYHGAKPANLRRIQLSYNWNPLLLIRYLDKNHRGIS